MPLTAEHKLLMKAGREKYQAEQRAKKDAALKADVVHNAGRDPIIYQSPTGTNGTAHVDIPDNSIPATSIGVPGALLKIDDGLGHVWAVPAESHEDYRLYQSPREMKHYKGYNPAFEYGCYRRDEINTQHANGWVGVSRAELGLDKLPLSTDQYGAPNDGLHWVEDQLVMKKPKVLVERERAAYTKFAKAVANSLEGPAAKGRANLDSEPNMVKAEIQSDQAQFAEPVKL